MRGLAFFGGPNNPTTFFFLLPPEEIVLVKIYLFLPPTYGYLPTISSFAKPYSATAQEYQGKRSVGRLDQDYSVCSQVCVKKQTNGELKFEGGKSRKPHCRKEALWLLQVGCYGNVRLRCQSEHSKISWAIPPSYLVVVCRPRGCSATFPPKNPNCEFSRHYKSIELLLINSPRRRRG